MKTNKYLVLSLAATLALGFVGIVNAVEGTLDRNLQQNLIKVVKQTKEILGDSGSPAEKEAKLEQLKPVLASGESASSSNSTTALLQQQYEETIRGMINKFKRNPENASRMAEKIKVPTTQQLEAQLNKIMSGSGKTTSETLEMRFKMGPAEHLTPEQVESVREMLKKIMGQEG